MRRKTRRPLAAMPADTLTVRSPLSPLLSRLYPLSSLSLHLQDRRWRSPPPERRPGRWRRAVSFWEGERERKRTPSGQPNISRLSLPTAPLPRAPRRRSMRPHPATCYLPGLTTTCARWPKTYRSRPPVPLPKKTSVDAAGGGPPASAPGLWEYKTPDGEVRGPFPAARIVTWMDKDFFPAEMEVREERENGGERGEERTRKPGPAPSPTSLTPSFSLF